MTSVYTIYGKLIDDILIEIDEYIVELTTPTHKLNAIYISIGGKINEKLVYFQQAGTIYKESIRVNSLEQMVPIFLRENTNNKTLIIVLDDFSSKPNYELNKNTLNKITNNNIHTILVQHLFTDNTLNTFIRYIINLSKTYEISPNHLMICNYVKHMNIPNYVEKQTEKMIPTVIQKVLNESCYSDCFYDWFGYNFYLYNFIYNYNQCIKINGVSTLIKDFEYMIKEQDNNDMNGISVIQNEDLLLLMESVYDITSHNDVTDTTKIATSIHDLMISRNQLMSPPIDSSYNFQD